MINKEGATLGVLIGVVGVMLLFMLGTALPGITGQAFGWKSLFLKEKTEAPTPYYVSETEPQDNGVVNVERAEARPAINVGAVEAGRGVGAMPSCSIFPINWNYDGDSMRIAISGRETVVISDPISVTDLCSRTGYVSVGGIRFRQPRVTHFTTYTPENDTVKVRFDTFTHSWNSGYGADNIIVRDTDLTQWGVDAVMCCNPK